MLVVKHELANGLRELVTLPLALKTPCGLAVPFRRGSTCGLDPIGGRAEFVRGDVRDGPGLPSSVRRMPCCPSKVSGRAHCVAARRASLHHRDLTTHPGAGVLDRFAWSRVIRLSRLEKVKDVLRARRRPKSEEMVIRISEGPTAANRHEARVPNLRKDHWLGAPSACVRPALGALGGQAAPSTVASFQHLSGPSVSCGLAGYPPSCTRQFRAFTLRGMCERSQRGTAMHKYAKAADRMLSRPAPALAAGQRVLA